LIVDDEPLNRKVLRVMCQLAGYESLEAEDGFEAVEAAREHRPTLILMDILMPRMDGLQATRLLVEDPETKHIPIFGLSGLAMEENRQQALAAGCREFFPKPLDLDEVREAIELVLAGSK